MVKEIWFVHEDKAHYPDIPAYKNYFSARYAVQEKHPSDLIARHYPGVALWYIMGFYPKAIRAEKIIHDYRSLSVGGLPWLKDAVKRFCNHCPDVRIFLNRTIKEKSGFSDMIPTCFLDMGLPVSILKYQTPPETYEYDFCYIGAISKERGIDAMIRQFIARYGQEQTLLMIGSVEDRIDAEFSDYPQVIFAGRKTQEEVFALVQKTEFAVCHLPFHRPYGWQTPTKLLEYAALGKKIVVNDSPSNLRVAEELGIEIYNGGKTLFPEISVLAEIKDNLNFNASGLMWEERIRQSGIEGYLT